MRGLSACCWLATSMFGSVQFYSSSGTPLSGSYTLPGPFLVGVKQTIRINFQADQPVCIIRVPSSQSTGFALKSVTPDLPVRLAPGVPIGIFIDFTPPAVARTANLNLEVQYSYDTASACSGPSFPSTFLRADLLLVVDQITTGITVSLQPGGESLTQVAFGNYFVGQTASLVVYLNNPGTTALTVDLHTPSGQNPDLPVPLDSPGIFILSGSPAGRPPLAFPLPLNPAESQAAVLQFKPTTSGAYLGSLAIGSVNIALSGTGVIPQIATPTIVVDPSLRSAIQSSLSITLSSAAPTDAHGTLFLSFQPSDGTTVDNSIQFLTGGSPTSPSAALRKIGFTIRQGDKIATIGAASQTALFQTGTTAGKLTFSIQPADYQAVAATAPVTVNIPPQAIQIDSALASRPNDVDLRVLLPGFDNSKSATQLAFTFYDFAGAAIPPGRITYDATRDFTPFFAMSTDCGQGTAGTGCGRSSTGGLFSLLADFPVMGSASKVASVDVELTNSVGTTKLPRLLFPCVPSTTVTCQ